MDIQMFVKSLILASFREGKDLEVRVRSRFVDSISVGQTLLFNDSVRRRVKAVRRYSNFDLMLAKEDYRRLYPKAESREWLLNELRKIYSTGRETAGVVVLELEEV